MRKPAVPVYVIPRKNSRFLYLRCYHPETGDAIERSSKRTTQKEALREAARWEADIATGRYKFRSPHSWETLRERYIDEELVSHKIDSAGMVVSVISTFEEYRQPELEKINASYLSGWVAWLRKRPVDKSGKLPAEATIVSHIARIKAMLHWAKKNGFIEKVPEFPAAKRAERSDGTSPMKGRPITETEYGLILQQTKDPEMRLYLEGMWHSGLRLEESLDLWWDRPDRMCIIEIDGKILLRVSSQVEKGNRNRILPLAPEFQEFLRGMSELPIGSRSGRVFFPSWKGVPSGSVISYRIRMLGRRAGVVVRTDPLKHASIHDFRRSFGTRWAMKVMPVVLKQLMRHSNIQTTMRYYVEIDALELSDFLVNLSGESATYATSEIRRNRLRGNS